MSGINLLKALQISLSTIITSSVLFFTLANVNHVYASTVPTGFTDTTISTTLSEPTQMTFAPDGRLFINERRGLVKIMKNNAILPTPFADLSADTQIEWESGLIGVAVDPNFAINRYVYIVNVKFTTTQIIRLQARADNLDVADMSTKTIIYYYNYPLARTHYAGALHFGNDGKLYLSTGDKNNQAEVQDLRTLSGKMLRLNPDGSIPADNPYVGNTNALPEIYALGFRNPFTFAVHPTNGTIFVNDVGTAQFEEVNQLGASNNYGWPTCEGPCNISGMTNPRYYYGRNVGSSITGGAFYTANQFPATYQNSYFFADYATGWIKNMTLANNQVTDFAQQAGSPVDLAVSPNGTLYYLTYAYQTSGTGSLHAISYQGSASAAPTPSPTPTPTPAPIIGYKPVPVIDTPQGNPTYSAGQTISYSGSATDQEDGTLPASAFSWSVIFHHNTHTHPFMGPINGTTSGQFTIPNDGETSANVFYRLSLSVTDKDGQVSQVSRDILPIKVRLTYSTVPAGLTVLVDDQPKTNFYEEDVVTGMQRSLKVQTPQILNGTTYYFSGWNNKQPQNSIFAAPLQPQFYTARFTNNAKNNVPNVESLTPTTGNSSIDQPTNFVTTYSDADGLQDLREAHFAINPAGNTCANGGYFVYRRYEAKVYLMKDDCSGLLGGVAIGTATIIENSSVKLNVGSMQLVEQGNQVSITWPVTFKTPLLNKPLYRHMLAGDYDVTTNSGWVDMGMWRANVPQVVSVSPTNGSSAPETPTIFTARYQHGDGKDKILEAHLIFNNSGQTCINGGYVVYRQTVNKLFLLDDNCIVMGQGVTPNTPSSAQTIFENSNIRVNLANVKILPVDANTFDIQWPISFKQAKKGYNMQMFAIATDATSNSGWVREGDWLVGTNAAPVATSITPVNGSSFSNQTQYFTTTATDTDGQANMREIHFNLNSGGNVCANGAYFVYRVAENKVYLINDSCQSLGTGITLGVPGSLSNSAVQMQTESIIITKNQNSITINWPVTFKASQNNKSLFEMLTVYDYQTSNWQQFGKWSVKP